MKITIEHQYPDESVKKYIYEDALWDHQVEDMASIYEGLLKQMGFIFDGHLVIENDEDDAEDTE